MKKEIKIFEAEVKEFNEGDLTVTHFISTEKRDRGGDVLIADGMRVTGRPVVLLQHGWGVAGPEPIAKPVWIKKGDFKNKKGIQAKTQFYPDELGKRLWDKCAHGYIPNWSIGWIPLKEEFITEKDGGRTRLVSEWELLEYSLVGVPMQPDAQNVDKTGDILFKVLDGCTEVEEKLGDLYLKTEDGQAVGSEEKPFPNEHACRLEDPDKYIRFRRANDKFGKGIHAIWGVLGGDEPVELQAIRFNKEEHTVPEARAWLKEHEYKCILFEPASEKCEACGGEMKIIWDRDVSGEKCALTCEAMFERCCNNPKCTELSLNQAISHLMREILGGPDKLKEYIDQLIINYCLVTTDKLMEVETKLNEMSVLLEKILVERDVKITVKEEPGENPPELVIEDDDDDEQAARDAIKDTVAEVVAELAEEEIDRLRGKVK